MKNDKFQHSISTSDLILKTHHGGGPLVIPDGGDPFVIPVVAEGKPYYFVRGGGDGRISDGTIISSRQGPFKFSGSTLVSPSDALRTFNAMRAAGAPVLSLSFQDHKTTCSYNMNLDPSNPAPGAADWLAKNLKCGRLRCPWCGNFSPVSLESIGDGPSVYPPRPMIYARLTHVGCPVVTETEKINVP